MSWVNTHRCLSVTHDFGPHGYLPRIIITLHGSGYIDPVHYPGVGTCRPGHYGIILYKSCTCVTEKSSTMPSGLTSNGCVPLGLQCYSSVQCHQHKFITIITLPEDISSRSLSGVLIMSVTWIVPVEALVNIHWDLTIFVSDSLDTFCWAIKQHLNML